MHQFQGGNEWHTFTVQGRNIILDNYRDAVQGTSWTTQLPLGIEFCSLLKGTRICFDYSSKGRTLKVHFLDPSEVRLISYKPSVSTTLVTNNCIIHM